jgi:predicted LPLAT superfamily acyltransferase
MKAAWLEQEERGSTTAMRLIVWLTLHVGRGFARLLLYPICLYFVLFSRKARQSSAEFLQRVSLRKPTLREIFRHYYTFATSIHDRIYLLAGRHDVFDLHVHGAESMKTALEKKRGCLAIVSHLGSFEILRSKEKFDGHPPVSVLMLDENANKINELFKSLNPDLAGRIITPGQPTTMMQVKECLERGEIVGVMGDRYLAGGKIAPCEFLGESAYFSEAPFRLAALLDVPVVLFFGLLGGENRYDVYFETLQSVEATANQREKIQSGLQQYVARLEYYCRQAPYNWFNFYDFWAKSDE